MMGLFTGFSLISGLEIIYWLWFKVILKKCVYLCSFVHFTFKVLLRDDNKVEPDKTITVKEKGEMDYGERGDKEKEVASLRQELERLTQRVDKMEHHKHHHHHHVK